MASAEDHARSSVEHFGGKWQDYFPIHNFFDVTRDMVTNHWVGKPDFRHRALRHHDVGIHIAEFLFGGTIINSEGYDVDVRAVGEQHMYEDFDCVPTFDDWWHGKVTPDQITDDGEKMSALILNINAEKWMAGHARILNKETA